MKQASPALFILIHNLSDEEKNFFKGFILINHRKDSNKLLDLFNEINASKKYDENILKQQFGKKNFRQLKNQLKNKVLDSLCLNTKNLGCELRRKLNHAALLADYGVHEEAQLTLRQLIKKIEQGVVAGGSAELHSALSQKSALLQRIDDENLDYSIDKLGKRIVQNINGLSFSMQLYYNYMRLARIRNLNPHLRSKVQKQEFAELKDYFSSVEEKTEQAFDQNLYIRLAKSSIAFIECDFQKYNTLEKRIFENIFADPELYANKGKSMLGNAFNGVTQSCFKTGDSVFLKKVIKKASPVYQKHFINDVHFWADFLCAKCMIPLLEKDLTIDSKPVNNLLLYYSEQKNRLNYSLNANVLYILMMSYHKLKIFPLAKEKCRLLLEIPRKVKVACDIREFAQLFYFINGCDQILNGIDDDINGYLRQLNSFSDMIRKQYEDYCLEKLLILFFKKIVSIPKSKRKMEFEKLKNDLSQLLTEKNQYVEQMFAKFNFLNWAEQRLL